MPNLLSAESHFEFGENWTDFLSVVNEAHKANAVAGVQKLFPDGELRGASFLDIGCGSGLHSLAAARLGAASVYSTDIDSNSVSATRRVLGEVEGKTPWKAEIVSVFDLPPGQFDVVYSWGVLHHTGDMWRAIHAASEQVKPGGLFALALYRKTRLCGAWKVAKAAYTKAPKWVRAPWRWLYITAQMTSLTLYKHKNPFAWVRNYKERRGMSYLHDVQDWLGGYPYESTTSEEVRSFLRDRGFSEVRSFIVKASIGLLGSGCDEYVFRRMPREVTVSASNADHI